MIKRIIYFIESPLSQFDYERYGVKILLQNGFIVEFWDFTEFLYPQVLKYDKKNLLKSDKILRFNNLSSALIAIDNITERDFVIIHIGFSYKHLKIYKHLSKSKVKYLVTQLSNIPIVNIKKKNYFLKLMKALLQPHKILNYFYTRIPYKVFGIREADFVLAAGTNSKSNSYPIGKNTEFIWAHTYEYDQFLSNKNLQYSNNYEKYCVFIDQNIPFHVDFFYDGIVSICDPDEYYCKLESFFSYIENNFNMKVIIAAHPRSDVIVLKKYFREREITKGSTFFDIKNSSLVLSHYSTAILFAILFNKPILFLTNDSFIDNELDLNISNFAMVLGRSVINIDHDYKLDFTKELLVNLEKYSIYIEHYVKKKDSPQEISTQILADRLKQIK